MLTLNAVLKQSEYHFGLVEMPDVFPVIVRVVPLSEFKHGRLTDVRGWDDGDGIGGGTIVTLIAEMFPSAMFADKSASLVMEEVDFIRLKLLAAIT